MTARQEAVHRQMAVHPRAVDRVQAPDQTTEAVPQMAVLHPEAVHRQTVVLQPEAAPSQMPVPIPEAVERIQVIPMMVLLLQAETVPQLHHMHFSLSVIRMFTAVHH